MSYRCLPYLEIAIYHGKLLSRGPRELLLTNMADTPNTSAALPQHAAPFNIPSHNIAPCPGCENIGPLKGDFHMDPLSLSPECIPLTLFNSYPQSPFKNSLDERITNPGPATQGEPEVGLDMHLSTTSQLSEVVVSPRNHTAIHNHECVNLGLSGTRWNAAFEDNTALDRQHGNLVRNLTVAPTIQPVQFQSRVGQQNVCTNMNQRYYYPYLIPKVHDRVSDWI